MVTVAFRVLKNRPLVIRSFHKKKEKQQSAAFPIKPEPFVTVGYRTKPLDEDTQSHIQCFGRLLAYNAHSRPYGLRYGDAFTIADPDSSQPYPFGTKTEHGKDRHPTTPRAEQRFLPTNATVMQHPKRKSRGGKYPAAAVRRIGAPGGTRTHTAQILRLLPLPIGIQGRI